MQKQGYTDNGDTPKRRIISWKVMQWMMSWKIWIIPVVLGIISTFIDLTFAQGRLKYDWLCWGLTLFCSLMAFGCLKKVIPVINNEFIMGAWICWGISIIAWLSQLFFHTSIHFNI